jgi:hypothetical protein
MRTALSLIRPSRSRGDGYQRQRREKSLSKPMSSLSERSPQLDMKDDAQAQPEVEAKRPPEAAFSMMRSWSELRARNTRSSLERT